MTPYHIKLPIPLIKPQADHSKHGVWHLWDVTLCIATVFVTASWCNSLVAAPRSAPARTAQDSAIETLSGPDLCIRSTAPV